MVPPEFHGHELCVIAHSRSKGDRKSTRLNSSHDQISYAVFCLKKKKKNATKQCDKMIPPRHPQQERPTATADDRLEWQHTTHRGASGRAGRLTVSPAFQCRSPP